MKESGREEQPPEDQQKQGLSGGTAIRQAGGLPKAVLGKDSRMSWRILFVAGLVGMGWLEGLVGFGAPLGPDQRHGAAPPNWLTQPTLAPAQLAERSSAEAVEWLVGEAACRRLKESVGPAGMVWKQTPLREALEHLAQSSRIAFLLDRRVDPGQLLEVEVENCSLLEAFAAIARDRALGVCLVGPVVYIGPPRAAEQLNTLIVMAEEHVQSFPPELQRRFFEPRVLAWPDLATPREIVTELARSAGLEVAGMDRLPHDLWARASLPPLSLVRRLCLVLQQFDLTFQVQPTGRQIALVPLPPQIALVRSYVAGADPQRRLQQIRQAAPDAEIRLSGQKIWVRGRLEDHHRIVRLLEPAQNGSDSFWELQSLLDAPPKAAGKAAKPLSSSSRPTPIEQIRIESLQIRNRPLREVLEVLGQRLGLEFRIPPEVLQKAGVSLERHISLEVEQATVDQLLEKIFQPLGLRVHRRQRVVEVGP